MAVNSEKEKVVLMVDAVSAFGDAFAAYKKSTREFAIYSVVMSLVSFALAAVLAIVLLAAGAVSIGSLTTMFASGITISAGLLGLGAAVAFLAVGMLIFMWLASGLSGSYLDTINMILTGRKQSVGGFFRSVPKFATRLFFVALLSSIIVVVPALIIGALFSLAGGIIAILGMVIAIAYALVMAMLLTFAAPAVVVDGKGPLPAVIQSIGMASRNFLAVILFGLMSLVAAIPLLVPVLGGLYMPLFYMPLTNAALVNLYKKAK